MKKHISICSILLFLSVFFFTSCQLEDTIVENPPVEDSIAAGSDIATLIQRAAIEDRSIDDFIDFANCLSINLPFTVVINQETFTITEENDYAAVLAFIDKFNNDYEVEFIFPIVITRNDFTQIVINSNKELIPYVAACQEESQSIPCIAFVFPFSFSVYDTEFEIIDTVVINSNEELYFFIGNIQAGTLVSLNFPVQLELQTEEIIEVNTNAELQDAIEAAALGCDTMGETDFSCFDNNTTDVLVTCVNAYNETAFFNLNDSVTQCENLVVFNISYHNTEEDALTNQNPISNAIEYALTSPFTDNSIYILVTAIENPEEFRIYELTLIVENCNDLICDETTLNSYLNECAWVTDGAISFTLEFNDDSVIASINNVEQTGGFSTAINTIESSGQFFSQFSLFGFTGDFAVLNTIYEVGFCSEGQIQVHPLDPATNTIPFTIMERDCTTGCDNPGFLTNDLIIYIPFGEEVVELISGEQLNDGAITYTEDRDGNPNCAAAFTNSGIIPISVTNQNNLISQDAFSVSIWFQMANDEPDDLETFFQKVNTTDEGFIIGVSNLNTPLCFNNNNQFSIWDDDWNNQIDVEWFNTDWHHLVITKTQNNVVQLWRDGILRNTMEGLDIGLETLSYNLGNNLVGNLDDLRVYKRILNNNEINQLFVLEADCFTCL